MRRILGVRSKIQLFRGLSCGTILYYLKMYSVELSPLRFSSERKVYRNVDTISARARLKFENKNKSG